MRVDGFAIPVNRLVAQFFAFAIASGILALPIFVGHEVVLAVKQLLDVAGLPDLASLAIVLIPFFVGMWIAYKRVMHYFAKT